MLKIVYIATIRGAGFRVFPVKIQTSRQNYGLMKVQFYAANSEHL